jgi:AraC family transcriptional activator of pobA
VLRVRCIPSLAREIGHFNVFESEKLFNKVDGTWEMPYSRMFCVFTTDFFWPSKSGILLDELPIFQLGNTLSTSAIFQLQF